MNYADIDFRLVDTQFQRNHKGDFACFALWKSARPYRDKIRDYLTENFEVLLETEIVWSEQYFHENAARLYEAPIFGEKDAPHRSNHAKKIGDNRFILFVVKDSSPEYTYARSVSGKIELSNLNVVRAKYAFRDWIREDTGVPYGVHSTNNIYEFFFQVPLLVGVELFETLLAGQKKSIQSINKDLEGAGGWSSYQELFRMLNLSSNYLVLRGFESLPQVNPEKDLDVLTSDYQRFASALGATQRQSMPFKGTVQVAGEPVSLDIRFVGDHYYYPVWAERMLATKVLRDGVFVPRADHYFFSLLFHAKVQKPVVKDKYYGILEDLANELGFEWYRTQDLDDDIKMGRMLNGYFRNYDYYYEDPVDGGVHKNRTVIEQLRTRPDHSRAKNLKTRVKTQVKSRVRQVLPEPLVPIVKKLLRR